MNTVIVGLGLIGGSAAKRMHGFRNTRVIGVDLNPDTLKMACLDGAIDEGTADASSVVADADFILLCLYPEQNVEFVHTYRKQLKSGAVISDVSGVKEYVLSEIEQWIPEGVSFVGGHPMAGREVGGYASATDTLFDDASYLITPGKTSTPEAVELVREYAMHIGCRRVVETTPKEHDEMIAYTSQLMHVVAIALCNHPLLEKSAEFSAGSLRDCTRIAVLNEVMWSELFLENRDALIGRISEFETCLDQVKNALIQKDRSALESLMKQATKQKLTWLLEKNNRQL